ncbi:hypothetical protein M8J76_010365 [Diaphorina citri]|nr:hypothetical protein M8J76_010365 [Diaphorina citri]
MSTDSGGDGGESGGNESDVEAQRSGSTSRGPNNCSLPLLQVWPSQDSPSSKNEREVHSFLFDEDGSSNSHTQHDSGIESVQVSPCPGPLQSVQLTERRRSTSHSPKERRASSSFLHPDHARFLRLQKCVSTDFTALDDETAQGGGVNNGSMNSSSASSMASIAQRHSEAWERRRSSVMTARYSLLDALDLEYALIRAAARGSVGPYSLTDSLHKLTFTQSLAFPALARGLAHKRRRSSQIERSSRPLDATDSGLNTFAKVITALVLMLVSVLVFFVVYKFVKT